MAETFINWGFAEIHRNLVSTIIYKPSFISFAQTTALLKAH